MPRLRWRLVRSLALCAVLGAGYATLVTLEVQPAPVELDGDNVGNNKNQKNESSTSSTQSNNTKPTYTYELTAPINSQLQISPMP